MDVRGWKLAKKKEDKEKIRKDSLNDSRSNK
jgi:hypothetical protein